MGKHLSNDIKRESAFRKEFDKFRRFPLLYFDRSFSSGTGKQIGWLLAIFVIVLAILFFVYCLIPNGGSMEERFSDLLYHLIDPGESDTMPLVFTVIVDVLGLIIFGGMLISVASNILERRIEAYNNGETSYPMKDHIIIIGFNDSIPSLINTIRKKNDDGREHFVLIQSEQEAGTIRRRLDLASDSWMKANTHIVYGTSNSTEDLDKLSIADCHKVYIIGDDTLEAHDSTNIECLQRVSEIWKSKHGKTYKEGEPAYKKKLHCHVLFEHQTVYSVFQFSELSKDIKKAIIFHPFTLEENWAKKVLVAGAANETLPFKPIEGEEGLNKDSKKHVHMIVIGMSRMGTSLAVETAQIAHYPNFHEDDDTTRTHITFIDNNAHDEMEVFMSRFPNVFEMMRWRYADASSCKENLYTLNGNSWQNPIEVPQSKYHHLGPNFTDLQWEFINGRIESIGVRRYLEEAVNDESAITTIAICLPNTQQATQAALYLPDNVLRKAHQVLIYQKKSDAIVQSINNPHDPCTKFDRLIPFGLTQDCYSNDKIGDEQGKWINAYYEKEYGTDADKEKWDSMDEKWANEKWDSSTVSNKWSSTHSANMLFTKLRSIGCTMKDSIETILAAMHANKQSLMYTEHNRWVTEQLLAGFRPLLLDEWTIYEQQEKDKKKPKNKQTKAHGNICSNETLKRIEPDSHEKDWQVTLALIEIMGKHTKNESID